LRGALTEKRVSKAAYRLRSRSLVRRASTLTTELERLEIKFALAGQADPADLDLDQKLTNTLRRVLESVGLKRQARGA
jgi:hypothetical protein